MTTCQYCRREYSQPPAECAGCGAPVPQAPPPSIFNQCAGLMSGMLGGGEYESALNAAIAQSALVAECGEWIDSGEMHRMTQAHASAAVKAGLIPQTFNVASLPDFNPYRVGVGKQMWNQYDGWAFDEYLNHYYYGEEPTR